MHQGIKLCGWNVSYEEQKKKLKFPYWNGGYVEKLKVWACVVFRGPSAEGVPTGIDIVYDVFEMSCLLCLKTNPLVGVRTSFR